MNLHVSWLNHPTLQLFPPVKPGLPGLPAAASPTAPAPLAPVAPAGAGLRPRRNELETSNVFIYLSIYRSIDLSIYLFFI